jgi:hypothetical protein
MVFLTILDLEKFNINALAGLVSSAKMVPCRCVFQREETLCHHMVKE